MTKLQDNRLTQAFSQLRSAGKKALLPFITAGFPDLDTTVALLADFEARGVRVCELGIPFSDPVADGPVIQASYTQALAAGVTSDKIFQAVARYRRDGGKLALVAMVSYSIVFRHGTAKFLADAAQAGIDGVIIPDLPLEEAATVEPLAAAAGLCNIMLVAPTSTPDRRRAIAAHSRGFLYYVSVSGITGQRTALPQATVAAVTDLRKLTDTPICVGFGVSNAATVETVCQVADGAIVGSAIVARIAQAASDPREQLVKQAGDFVSELLKPIA
ncbi:MAG: tryptophan synthase subunit alpha [Phycisphaerae bacterium]|jgi:tryptophan synthase alpha chain